MPSPMCPLRFGEPCTLCQLYVTGPEDCQTVKLVMEDPELRAEWAARRAEYNRTKREQRAATRAPRADRGPDLETTDR